MKAWSELHAQPEASHGLRQADRDELTEVLMEEEDGGVREFGHLMVTRAGSRLEMTDAPAPAQQAPAPATSGKSVLGHRQPLPDPKTLDEFVFQHFEKPSAVLSIAEENYHRRDENAMVHIARRLPAKDYRLTTIENDVLLGDDSWAKKLVRNNCETILITGRPCLYGQKALDCLKDDRLRFRFPMQGRPETLENGAIDKEFHCIHECEGSGARNVYSTKEMGKTRTDFGLIQVYSIYNGRHWMTVVLCAGCSSLGTFGAAWWLTYEIWRPHGVNGSSAIPVPPRIRENPRMEALISVTGDATKPICEPLHLELCGLYLDDYMWAPQGSQWRRTRAPVIDVAMEGNKPVWMSIDSEPARLVPHSQNFRLATQLALAVKRSTNGSVSVASLAENRYIWSGRTIPTSKVKQRLNNLNHGALKDLITVDHDEVRLAAEVVVTYL